MLRELCKKYRCPKFVVYFLAQNALKVHEQIRNPPNLMTLISRVVFL